MEKKIILITGASSGIGKSVAQQLSKNHTVYGTSRKANNGESIDGITFVQLDVQNDESIQKAVNWIINKHQKIDVLINNAGIGLMGALETTPREIEKQVWDTNVFGLLDVYRTVAPHMREQKSGFIINISSIAGFMGLAYRGIYSASKAAVHTLTETMSAELQPFNIKVCSLAPGDVKTEIGNGRLIDPTENTPYSERVIALEKHANEEVNKGIEPVLIAQKIEKIIRLEKPKMHYKVASLLQKLAPTIKFLLPGRTFEKMLNNTYTAKE